MPRTLLTGWFSFLHSEVTAGDLLVADVVRDALRGASIPYDTAWSPTFRPAGLHLGEGGPVRVHAPGLRVRAAALAASRGRRRPGAAPRTASALRRLPAHRRRRVRGGPGRPGGHRVRRGAGARRGGNDDGCAGPEPARAAATGGAGGRRGGDRGPARVRRAPAPRGGGAGYRGVGRRARRRAAAARHPVGRRRLAAAGQPGPGARGLRPAGRRGDHPAARAGAGAAGRDAGAGRRSGGGRREGQRTGRGARLADGAAGRAGDGGRTRPGAGLVPEPGRARPGTEAGPLRRRAHGPGPPRRPAGRRGGPGLLADLLRHLAPGRG